MEPIGHILSLFGRKPFLFSLWFSFEFLTGTCFPLSSEAPYSRLATGRGPLNSMSKYCWTLAATWLWLSCCCLRISAGSQPQFNIAQWRSDTIAPQNAVITAVITITQTRDGYLWLGTPEGLLRFDGVSFTAFNEGNTPGLKSGSVVKLFEDSRTNF